VRPRSKTLKLAEFVPTSRKSEATSEAVAEIVAEIVTEVAEDVVVVDEVVVATMIAVIEIVVTVVEMIVTGRLVATMTSARTVGVTVDAAPLHLRWRLMIGLFSAFLCSTLHLIALTHPNRGVPVVHASPPPTSKPANGAKQEVSPSKDKKRSREDDGEGERTEAKKAKADAA
jgi:hypothetical protein